MWGPVWVLTRVGFCECPCPVSSDASSRVGAGAVRSGVGMLASPRWEDAAPAPARLDAPNGIPPKYLPLQALWFSRPIRAVGTGEVRRGVGPRVGVRGSFV